MNKTYVDLKPQYERAFYKRAKFDLGKLMDNVLEFIDDNGPIYSADVSMQIPGPSMTACLCLMKEGAIEYQ